MCRVGEVGLTPMSCEVRVRHELLRRPTADGVTTRGLERANDCGPERRPRRWRSSGRCTAMRSRSAPTDPPATTSAPIARPQVRPVIETVWRWCRSQLYPTDLLPKSPPAKALNYALQRRSILEVFLADPEVAIDTNHSERELRKLRLGKRNWLFNLTEIGAQLEASAASLPPRPFQLLPVGTTVARRKFYPLKERASYGALRMPANRLYFGNFSKKNLVGPFQVQVNGHLHDVHQTRQLSAKIPGRLLAPDTGAVQILTGGGKCTNLNTVCVRGRNNCR